MVKLINNVGKVDHLCAVSLVESFDLANRNAAIVVADHEVLQVLTIAQGTGLAMCRLVTHGASSASLLLRRQGRDVLNCRYSALADALPQLLIVKEDRVIIATGEVETAVVVLDHGQAPCLTIVMRSDQDVTLGLLRALYDEVKLQNSAVFQARQDLLSHEVH